jgi:hypothetical protein
VNVTQQADHGETAPACIQGNTLSTVLASEQRRNFQPTLPNKLETPHSKHSDRDNSNHNQNKEKENDFILINLVVFECSS